MGFLDQKERILDVVLTAEGRSLLSKNQLNFKYYAFSDEGMDYSGSLSSSVLASSSFENYVHRDLSFEADQRKDRDLNSFLYTISQGEKILPEFKINVDATSSIILKRQFFIDSIILQNKDLSSIDTPVDVVIRASAPQKTNKDRTEDFVSEQKLRFILNVLEQEK